jgi:hypothetical protein
LNGEQRIIVTNSTDLPSFLTDSSSAKAPHFFPALLLVEFYPATMKTTGRKQKASSEVIALEAVTRRIAELELLCDSQQARIAELELICDLQQAQIASLVAENEGILGRVVEKDKQPVNALQRNKRDAERELSELAHEAAEGLHAWASYKQRSDRPSLSDMTSAEDNSAFLLRGFVWGGVRQFLGRTTDPQLRQLSRQFRDRMIEEDAVSGRHGLVVDDFVSSVTLVGWAHSELALSFGRSAVCTAAARAGNVQVLRYLRSKDEPTPWDLETSYAAALGGHLETLQWLRAQDPPCPWDDSTCTAAASTGQLPVLEWLRSGQTPCPWAARTCAAAASAGQMRVLEWLREQDPPCNWTESTFLSASEAPDCLEVLAWMRAQQPPCPWSVWNCWGVAEAGELATLQWMRTQKPPCPWDEKACGGAARVGRVDVIKWLREQSPPCPWAESTCELAASEGQVLMLGWLRDQDPPCPWGARTCMRVEFNPFSPSWGVSVETMVFLRTARSSCPPCPWDTQTQAQWEAWDGWADAISAT